MILFIISLKLSKINLSVVTGHKIFDTGCSVILLCKFTQAWPANALECGEGLRSAFCRLGAIEAGLLIFTVNVRMK
jgi:hypothetical protein